ncbi:MAG: LysM peptidoglycan-binding domain-containing protein [Anaerolineae bacterium]|nr:LysM peptidoglycan-binding domain-containing protein [Anaerolineae bacterium]
MLKRFFHVHRAAIVLGALLMLLLMPGIVRADDGYHQPYDPYAVGIGGVGYVVQAGDTLSSIGRQYGVSVAMLTRANNIANPNIIYVGQWLIIPNVGTGGGSCPGAAHVVRPGETLFRIGLAYGYTYWQLAYYNGLPDPNIIEVGQVICIPS